MGSSCSFLLLHLHPSGKITVIFTCKRNEEGNYTPFWSILLLLGGPFGDTCDKLKQPLMEQIWEALTSRYFDTESQYCM